MRKVITVPLLRSFSVDKEDFFCVCVLFLEKKESWVRIVRGFSASVSDFTSFCMWCVCDWICVYVCMFCMVCDTSKLVKKKKNLCWWCL